MSSFNESKPAPTLKLKSGSEIPCIGMGTFGSDHANPEQIAAAVAGAIRIGYRLFDCASVYGNEHKLGKVFSDSISEGIVERSDLYITSKVWNDMHGIGDVIKSAKKTLCD